MNKPSMITQFDAVEVINRPRSNASWRRDDGEHQNKDAEQVRFTRLRCDDRITECEHATERLKNDLTAVSRDDSGNDDCSPEHDRTPFEIDEEQPRPTKRDAAAIFVC